MKKTGLWLASRLTSAVERKWAIAVAIAVLLTAAPMWQAYGRGLTGRQSKSAGKQHTVARRVRPAAANPGDLDTTFGTNGKVSTDFANNRDQGFALAVQSDGKIVVVGSAVLASGQQPDFAVARYNSDGSLDTSFGSAGKVTTDFGGNDEAAGVAIQSDGKIVVVGGTCANSTLGCTNLTGSGFDFAIARYNTDGSPDSSFGTGGKVTTDFNGGMDLASSVLIQPDGNIVVGGTACSDSSLMCALSGGVQFALARYNTDGSLDATFGTGGKVFTQVMDFGSILTIALQSDGKILAGGLAFNPAPRFDSDFELVRYNSNGTLDDTFGTGGKVNTDFNTVGSTGLNDAIVSLALQPDGKIVAVGASETNTQSFFYDFSIARYNSNGSLDTSFGSGGKVTTDISGGDDQAGSVIIQPDGKILVGGIAAGMVFIGTDSLMVSDSGTAPGSDFAVVRYNSNGTLDTGFGNNGKVRTDFFGSSDAAKFALEPDGRLVGAGFARHSLGAATHARPPRGMKGALLGWALSIADDQPDADFALARYETGVTPQPDFTISLDPSTVTTPKGKKITVTVNINRTGGFTGNVTVSPPATLPKAVKVPSGAVSTTGSSVSIKIKVKAGAASGTDQLTFSASDGSGKTHTATLTLIVQ